jgi:hypothetical protein
MGHRLGNYFCYVREVVAMHDESEMHQLMLERMQMLEEALERAETGVATEDDWNIIRYECGMPKRLNIMLETATLSRSE